MRVLVLGGTKFVGRHVVEAALARGDELTLFNRGRTAPRLFEGIEQLRGDRGGDLDALRRGGPWDVAIDVSGYEPEQVAASSRALSDRVEHLTFVSTISVYAGQAAAVIDEDAALDADGDGYGPRKARCEQAVHAALPERALAVRPGVIAGPHDPTNRFSWWVARLARGGRLLAPGAPDRVVQLIDARDLAAWMLDMAQRRATGMFNAVGPQAPLTMDGLLRACEPDAELVWVAIPNPRGRTGTRAAGSSSCAPRSPPRHRRRLWVQRCVKPAAVPALPARKRRGHGREVTRGE